MPQALSLRLKQEGHLCRYECYFVHKPELNCSPDKTMFYLKIKQNTQNASHEVCDCGGQGRGARRIGIEPTQT